MLEFLPNCVANAKARLDAEPTLPCTPTIKTKGLSHLARPTTRWALRDYLVSW